MAEDPRTWGKAEKIIKATLDSAKAAHEAGMAGWSTPKQIAEALRTAHLLDTEPCDPYEGDLWPNGDQDKEHYCSYQYAAVGLRCPNPVDFAVKVPDGRSDWRKAWLACGPHLVTVLWTMEEQQGGARQFQILKRGKI